ncbi:NAD(P)H-flavin reductase [Halomonas sp. WWR20]
MTARILTCHVERVEDLTDDVFRVCLEGRTEAIAHAPGQYLELKLDEDTWVPFSIANAHGGDGVIELHIQHWPERANSLRLRQMLHRAATITVRMPGGECVLDPASSRPLLLIAAGTGFAQMKAMLETALTGAKERPIALWWAARERRDLYLETLAREWAARYAQFHLHLVIEAPQEEIEASPGVDVHYGRVDEALARQLQHSDVSDHDVYISGSPGMVYACVDTLAPLGLDETRVFSDVFAYAPRVPFLPLPDGDPEQAPLSPGEEEERKP